MILDWQADCAGQPLALNIDRMVMAGEVWLNDDLICRQSIGQKRAMAPLLTNAVPVRFGGRGLLSRLNITSGTTEHGSLMRPNGLPSCRQLSDRTGTQFLRLDIGFPGRRQVLTAKRNQ